MSGGAIIALVVAFVVAAIVIGGRKKKPKPPAAPASDWTVGPIVGGLNYSVGMPPAPTPQGEGWTLDLPLIGKGELDAVIWHRPPSLTKAKELRVRYSVTGGDFVASGSELPAIVSVMIQRRGDDWSGVDGMASYRWYSKTFKRLVSGPGEMVLPLTPDAWANVYGKQDATGFAAAIREASSISITFGSDSGRSHGVYALAPARFTLTSIEVIR